ncbi:hypothetical protein QBC47DRAFT_443214 [Echria macrotheca]|uniref:Methyltransferase type 11 domain-containing protein n=1 Tax=Echria macrotheca TaxID=438768 RepID=A0AAJ0F7D7_9PEZI|nr:hypothetical protein QBC47DRAFT_443214 [Echria macrotheca]
MATTAKTPAEIAAAAKANAGTYLAAIPPEINTGKRLLERYSGISPDKVDEHIIQIRDKAWTIFPYGCIGTFNFLNLDHEDQDAQFQRVVARLVAPGSTETFLDVGCCMGGTIRYLADRGVASQRLYGTDLQGGFLELGYELFGDGDGDSARRSWTTFVAGDMTMMGESGDGVFAPLEGTIDVIYASNFFHLFEREGQVRAAKRMVGFLRAGNPDVLIFGRNMGRKIQGWERYILDERGWRGMWEEVGEATGTAWETTLDVDESEEGWIKVKFVVRRGQ